MVERAHRFQDRGLDSMPSIVSIMPCTLGSRHEGPVKDSRRARAVWRNLTVKVVPASSSLATSTSPPWAATSRRTMAKPMPEPPERTSRPRKKRSKTDAIQPAARGRGRLSTSAKVAKTMLPLTSVSGRARTTIGSRPDPGLSPGGLRRLRRVPLLPARQDAFEPRLPGLGPTAPLLSVVTPSALRWPPGYQTGQGCRGGAFRGGLGVTAEAR